MLLYVSVANPLTVRRWLFSVNCDSSHGHCPTEPSDHKIKTSTSEHPTPGSNKTTDSTASDKLHNLQLIARMQLCCYPRGLRCYFSVVLHRNTVERQVKSHKQLRECCPRLYVLSLAVNDDADVAAIFWPGHVDIIGSSPGPSGSFFLPSAGKGIVPCRWGDDVRGWAP